MISNIETQKRLLRLTGIIAILVALLTTTADEILQYSPQGGYATFAYVRNFAFWRPFSGHVLGVLAIPLLAVGYWHICHALKLSGVKHTSLLFWIMAYGLAVGAAAHGSFAGLVVMAQMGTSSSLTTGQSYFLTYGGPLFAATLLCYAITSIWYCIIILSRRTLYPKWMAFLSPFFISLAIALFQVSNSVPVLGNILGPAWLNFAHVVFFALSTCVLWNPKEERVSSTLQVNLNA